MALAFSTAKTMRNKPELQLIADSRHGDVDAIAELFRRHYALSLRVARRILLARDESLDAVQSAYLSAFRNFSSFRGESSFKTWITKIVINQCVMHFRNSSWQRRWVSLDDSFPGSAPAIVVDQAPTPEDLVRSAEIHRKVIDTAGRLPRPLRDAFVLVYNLRALGGRDCEGPGSYRSRHKNTDLPCPLLHALPNSGTCAVKRTEVFQQQSKVFPVNAR